MSTTTNNLRLIKQTGSEYYSIDVVNANLDTIDTAIGDIWTTVSPKFTVNFDASTFSSGANLSYADGLSGLTPLNNSATTGTVNSSMSWGSWQTLENNPYLKDCYYSVIYGDGEEIKLNPYNLAQGLDGTDCSTLITQENVMFNIPTRYINRTASGFTHSRNPAYGDALAHTIDGTVYPYLAIGVYPSVNVSSVAKSVSGVKPSASINRTNFRTYSKANGNPSNGVWLQWNWDQAMLIRDMVLMSTLNWDSQTRIGRGNLSGSNNSNWAVNGLYNSAGLFAGSQSTGAGYAVKALIENMWGQCWQFVDDVVTGDTYSDGGYWWKDVWAGQNSSPTITSGETDSGAIVTSDKRNIGRFVLGASSGSVGAGWKYASAIGTTNAGWGLSSATGGSTSSYMFDGYYTAANTSTTARNCLVGGDSNNASLAGVSALRFHTTVSDSSWHNGSRLAFVHS